MNIDSLYLLALIQKYSPVEIGKEILTPDDDYVYSFKLVSPFDIEVRLKGTIHEIKIEGSFEL